MEINIKNESLPVSGCICRTENKFTAECDVIVPDSKPDILKILQLSARPRISNREMKNGRITVTGTVSFNIIYLADDEEKSIKSITSSCEFSNVIRDDSIGDNMLSFVDVDVCDLNCSVINCRKITLHTSLCMAVKIYSCFELNLISDIEGACTKTRKLSSSVICAHAEDHSLLTDSFSLSPGKLPVCEILKSDAAISEREIKIIDDKAIIKGNLRITVLYKTESGLEYAQSEIPFAHILQADGIREDMDYDYCVKVLDINADATENTDGQMCIIDFSADLFFRVIARGTYSVNCVTDAFLPHGNLECGQATVSVDSMESNLQRSIDVREKITLPENFPDISSVYQVVLHPVTENCSVDGEMLRVSGYTEVYILYLSNDSESPVYSYKTNIDFSSSFESPGCMITPVSDSVLRSLSYTINSEKCVEVRATIDVSVQCIKTTETETVYSAEQKEYIPVKRPSIIVSCMGNNRSLWDIAKEYSVSPQSILAANAFESENDLTSHMALIIPK